ncbi:MAG TPA: ComEC/Rec2 family competence protein, partial [bacterium]|nr:ComEC/Rec2 family competence protein [bacterium]
LMGGAYWVELCKGRVATAARPRRPAPVATDTTARAARAVTTETAVAAAPAPPPEPAAPVSGGKLILWVVDVGQGDGLVLRMPNGKFAVVDVAREGGEAVMALLRAKGCSRITDMVLTHPHADHIGDMANVLKKFRVGRFLESGAGHATSSYRYLLAALKRKRTDVDTARSGMRLNWDPQVQVTVLHADANPEKDNLNNSSVVLRVQYGRTSMLLMGDAEAEVEQDLLANSRRQLNADVLKVGHHGSHSSSTAAFIDAVSPKYALISAGANNRFHHPHPTTVSTLTEHNARVYRTDRHGTITATSDGQRVTMSTEQGGR